MERKDVISLTISAIALLVSCYVFVDAKLSESQAEQRALVQSLHASYRLGKQHAAYVVGYLHATQGPEADIQEFREELLSSMHKTQGYADILDLRIDVERLFRNYDPESIFNDDLRGPISERIRAVQGAETASMYEATFWTYWLLVNLAISEEKGNLDEIKDQIVDVAIPHLVAHATAAGLEVAPQSPDPSLGEMRGLATSIEAQLASRFQHDAP